MACKSVLTVKPFKNVWLPSAKSFFPRFSSSFFSVSFNQLGWWFSECMKSVLLSLHRCSASHWRNSSLKMKICSSSGHPRCRWVCFFIRTNLEKCCSAMDPLQWMGAVRMRVQTADKNITIIHTTPVYQLIFYYVKSCVFVRNKFIKAL